LLLFLDQIYTVSMNTGDLAKDFELPNERNNKIKLFDRVNSLKGAPLFLVFYKFNCPTCQFTFPHLARVARALGPEYFLAVAQDTQKEAEDFKTKYQFNFEVICDTHPFEVSQQYKIDFVPTVFIIEPDRKISQIAEGFDRKAIEDFADRILVGRPISGFQAFDPSSQVPLLKPG
jgi:peroxiredoxin